MNGILYIPDIANLERPRGNNMRVLLVVENARIVTRRWQSSGG
jgi:hypothetical protein